MSKIECLFTIFPVLILMYATFYFMPYFVGKKHIYGVSIDQEHKNYNYFIKLDKNLKTIIFRFYYRLYISFYSGFYI